MDTRGNLYCYNCRAFVTINYFRCQPLDTHLNENLMCGGGVIKQGANKYRRVFYHAAGKKITPEEYAPALFHVERLTEVWLVVGNLLKLSHHLDAFPNGFRDIIV